MKKDKASKEKINPENSDQQEQINNKDTGSSTLEEVIVEFKTKSLKQKIDILFNHPEKPLVLIFEVADSLTIERYEKFIEIIIKLCKYTKNTNNPDLILGSEKLIKENRQILYNQRAEIYKVLTELIPEETQASTPSGQFIRLCKLLPEFLDLWADIIVMKLKSCRDSVDKKWKFKTEGWKKEKAVEIFLKEELDPIYEKFVDLYQKRGIRIKKKSGLKKIISPADICESSDQKSALRLLSIMANCSYDGLHDLFYSRSKSAKL